MLKIQKTELHCFLNKHPYKYPCGHFWTPGPSCLLSKLDTISSSLHNSFLGLFALQVLTKCRGLGALLRQQSRYLMPNSNFNISGI